MIFAAAENTIDGVVSRSATRCGDETALRFADRS